MLDATEIKKGMKILVDGKLFNVLEMQHHKPGKGGAMMRTKIKNMESGVILERTFRGGDKIEQVSLERKKYQFLYTDGSGCHFMNMETYEQIALEEDKLGKSAGFLQENMEVTVLLFNEKVIGVDLPKTVVMKITYTEPGHRGDTATNVQKAAKVESGIEVKVPLFINMGDSIIVNVETGKYVSRK